MSPSYNHLYSDKEVVPHEDRYHDHYNAPMLVHHGHSAGILHPVREADKEVAVDNDYLHHQYHHGQHNYWQQQQCTDCSSSASSSACSSPRQSREFSATWRSHSHSHSPASSSFYELESPDPVFSTQNHESAPPPAYGELVQDEWPRWISSNGSQTHAGGEGGRCTELTPDDMLELLPARPEDRSTVGHLLGWIQTAARPSPHATSPSPGRKLQKPVVIPQLDVPPRAEIVPFQRCYADALAAHDVPMHDFLAFLDGLAIAQAPTGALQGLKVVGTGLSFVPLPISRGVGRGLTALATLNSGHEGARAKLYLARANHEYFRPRGLRLSVVKDEDLSVRVLGLPPSAPALAPLTRENMTSSVCDRRFEAVKPFAAQLRYDVPEVNQEVKLVDQLARKQLTRKMTKRAKGLAKSRDGQWEKRGFEGATEELKLASRLRWLVIQEVN